MLGQALLGRSILVVEDEPLILMDLAKIFKDEGAEVTTTNTLRHALVLVEHDGISAAILDHVLGNDDSSLLCLRLRERGIPFMIYSGYKRTEGACRGAPHLSKPATGDAIMAEMENLLRGAPISN